MIASRSTILAATEWLSARARWHPLEYRVLDRRICRDLPAPGPTSDPDRDRLARTVRALARPDPRLCRHHLARPCRVFRLRRLHRRAARQARDHQRAGVGTADFRGRRDAARFRHQLPGAARLRSDAADGDARRGAGAARIRQPLRLAHRRRRRPAGRHHSAAVRNVPFRYVRSYRLRLLLDRAVHSCS